MKQLLIDFAEMLKKPDQESLKLSLNNVHAKDMFSLVIKGTEFGNLTRVFIAGSKLKPFQAQLHTHRYPLRLTVIKGTVRQHTAILSDYVLDNPLISMFEYRSFLNGGNGLKFLKETRVQLNEFTLPTGSIIDMGVDEFHTISCSKGAIWIVEELGFKVDSSKVLGVPFVVDNLYTEPSAFQINDKCQLVLREINQLLKNYDVVK